MAGSRLAARSRSTPIRRNARYENPSQRQSNAPACAVAWACSVRSPMLTARASGSVLITISNNTQPANSALHNSGRCAARRAAIASPAITVSAITTASASGGRLRVINVLSCGTKRNAAMQPMMAASTPASRANATRSIIGAVATQTITHNASEAVGSQKSMPRIGLLGWNQNTPSTLSTNTA